MMYKDAKNAIEINSNPNVKYVTKTNFITDDNGEIHQIDEVEVYKRYYGKTNFWKVWLTDFLIALDLVNNSKQMEVAFHILENTKQSDNTYIGTYRKIADDSGISYQTVARTVQKMIDAKMMTKVQNGVYKVNPSLIMKGDDQKQKRLIIEYQDADSSEQ